MIMAEDEKGPKAADGGQVVGAENRNPRILIELDLVTLMPVAKWENCPNFPFLLGLMDMGTICIRETMRQAAMKQALDAPMGVQGFSPDILRKMRSGH
jgi:hypothetical protein